MYVCRWRCCAAGFFVRTAAVVPAVVPALRSVALCRIALRRIAPRAAALHKASTIAAVVGTSLWSRGVRVFIGYYLCVRTKIDNNGNHWLT